MGYIEDKLFGELLKVIYLKLDFPLSRVAVSMFNQSLNYQKKTFAFNTHQHEKKQFDDIIPAMRFFSTNATTPLQWAHRSQP